MDFGIKGKKALVSASSDGIGFAIAQALLQEGVEVYINGRSQQSVEEAISKLEGKALSLPYDLSTLEGFKKTIQMVPAVDILINNLGIYEVKPFEEITDQDWLHIFEVNVLSGIRLSRHYFPKMVLNKWGRIIFISSESGVQTPKEMIHYGMTKTAQLAVARGLSELTSGTNVTVNSILPGPTYSRGVKEFVTQVGKSQNKQPQEVEAEFFKTVRPTSLIQRFAHTNEVGALVAFVCSMQAAAINGASLRVDGGVVRSIV